MVECPAFWLAIGGLGVAFEAVDDGAHEPAGLVELGARVRYEEKARAVSRCIINPRQ